MRKYKRSNNDAATNEASDEASDQRESTLAISRERHCTAFWPITIKGWARFLPILIICIAGLMATLFYLGMLVGMAIKTLPPASTGSGHLDTKYIRAARWRQHETTNETLDPGTNRIGVRELRPPVKDSGFQATTARQEEICCARQASTTATAFAAPLTLWRKPLRGLLFSRKAIPCHAATCNVTADMLEPSAVRQLPMVEPEHLFVNVAEQVES